MRVAAEADEIQRLIKSSRAGLVPVSIPPYRTLDVSVLADCSQRDETVFCDVFWVQPGRLAFCAVRIDGGPRGVLASHALKAVLRAALRHHPADQALALSVQAFDAYAPDLPIDAAVAILDTRDGAATIGVRGTGTALRLRMDASPPVRAQPLERLARGEALGLSVGPVGRAPPYASASADATKLVSALAAGPGTAAAAIVLRDYSEGGAGTFILPNDVAAISPLLADLSAYLAGRKIQPETWASVEVALDELLTNIVLYAYRDGGGHEIVVDACVEKDVLRIQIRDDGVPFDPTTVPPPDLEADLDGRPLGGLGLHFARLTFDGIAYRRDRGWNVLMVEKTRAGLADAWCDDRRTPPD